MSIAEKFYRRARAVESLLCVGLDTAFDSLPPQYQGLEQPQYRFNLDIIRATYPYTAAYKLNAAFYEARGVAGVAEMALTAQYLRDQYPNIVTICDAKRGDISSTSAAYAAAIFDEMGFDAVTLHPYLGREALEPFLCRQDKACIILCRTSNPGAGELQDLRIEGKPLWQIVAGKVRQDWNAAGNCMLVVGATYPEEVRQVRALVGDMTLLVPGIGAQGGDVRAVVEAGLNSAGGGLMMSASRSIIFAENPADSARDLRDEINRWR